MGLFGKRDRRIEEQLRDARHEPPAELVDGIVRMVSGSQARRPARARFALAAALTLAFLVVFASFGGVAYATGAASKAASAVSKKAGGSDSKSGSTQGNGNNSNNSKNGNNGRRPRRQEPRPRPRRRR